MMKQKNGAASPTVSGLNSQVKQSAGENQVKNKNDCRFQQFSRSGLHAVCLELNIGQINSVLKEF
jgi:hypothetical protein